MTNEQMAACFNEWMRRFIEEPGRFEQEFETVNKFLADEAGGQKPSYGAACTALMNKLSIELAA